MDLLTRGQLHTEVAVLATEVAVLSARYRRAKARYAAQQDILRRRRWRRPRRTARGTAPTSNAARRH
jgi:hypothetical protein